MASRLLKPGSPEYQAALQGAVDFVRERLFAASARGQGLMPHPLRLKGVLDRAISDARKQFRVAENAIREHVKRVAREEQSIAGEEQSIASLVIPPAGPGDIPLRGTAEWNARELWREGYGAAPAYGPTPKTKSQQRRSWEKEHWVTAEVASILKNKYSRREYLGTDYIEIGKRKA